MYLFIYFWCVYLYCIYCIYIYIIYIPMKANESGVLPFPHGPMGDLPLLRHLSHHKVLLKAVEGDIWKLFGYPLVN